MNDLLHSAELQLRATKRILPKAPLSRQRFGSRDDRYVFVVGSPRSGTTFLGESIGSVPGLLDLGEVEPLKDAIRRIAHLDRAETAAQIRRVLIRARRLSLVGGIRPVEQTPEMAHILPAVVEAFPQGRVVHALRDGRDVVCSLLERGWLRAENKGRDYAGPPFGPRARFWVEEERRDEFPQVSDARRAAWAWRRYVTAVRTSGVPVTEVRYERMATDPEAVGRELAEALDISAPDMIAALRKAHTESIGRYARDLTEEELADVLAEAGDLLEELGYLQRV
ncbi:MAG: sulfotransferase family protein [Gaiellaceae bacterium]